jgi:hypothetical protein
MNVLQIAMIILTGFAANLFVGSVVLSVVDRNNALYHWVWKASPYYLLSILTVTLWPLVVTAYLFRRR